MSTCWPNWGAAKRGQIVQIEAPLSGIAQAMSDRGRGEPPMSFRPSENKPPQRLLIEWGAAPRRASKRSAAGNPLASCREQDSEERMRILNRERSRYVMTGDSLSARVRELIGRGLPAERSGARPIKHDIFCVQQNNWTPSPSRA